MRNLAAAADRGPTDFADLLLTPGVGARTVQALAMVAEVVHGAPYRFTDPARFSFAHGGKDASPLPGAAQGLRRDHPRAEIGGAQRKARARRGACGDSSGWTTRPASWSSRCRARPSSR